jgi:hypothetical protein
MENEIIFLEVRLNFFLRDRKSNKKKVAEEYCWVMTGRGSHVAGDQCVGAQI